MCKDNEKELNFGQKVGFQQFYGAMGRHTGWVQLHIDCAYPILEMAAWIPADLILAASKQCLGTLRPSTRWGNASKPLMQQCNSTAFLQPDASYQACLMMLCVKGRTIGCEEHGAAELLHHFASCQAGRLHAHSSGAAVEAATFWRQ